ncbi:MAG: pirin family protein, partial [Alphaproteobacteria bacterium]|nr:pirin family protein [Alphaproteobacteria bacterium]
DGGVQWMTAGRGVVHSEMPAQTSGLMSGFQLWLNLPAAEKMRAPWYADIPASAIVAVAVGDGVTAKLIAGAWSGARGPGPERVTQPFIADVAVGPGATAEVPVPDGHNAFAFIIDGTVEAGGRVLRRGELAVLSDAGPLALAAGTEAARLLVVAAKPLREPIAKYGPFVMNTEAELRQAFADYQRGAL